MNKVPFYLSASIPSTPSYFELDIVFNNTTDLWSPDTLFLFEEISETFETDNYETETPNELTFNCASGYLFSSPISDEIFYVL